MQKTKQTNKKKKRRNGVKIRTKTLKKTTEEKVLSTLSSCSKAKKAKKGKDKESGKIQKICPFLD